MKVKVDTRSLFTGQAKQACAVGQVILEFSLFAATKISSSSFILFLSSVTWPSRSRQRAQNPSLAALH